MMTIGQSGRVQDVSLLKEKLVEPVESASHYLMACVYKLLRGESDREVLVALHKDLAAWEKLSDEALENFEKRFD